MIFWKSYLLCRFLKRKKLGGNDLHYFNKFYVIFLKVCFIMHPHLTWGTSSDFAIFVANFTVGCITPRSLPSIRIPTVIFSGRQRGFRHPIRTLLMEMKGLSVPPLTCVIWWRHNKVSSVVESFRLDVAVEVAPHWNMEHAGGYQRTSDLCTIKIIRFS